MSDSKRLLAIGWCLFGALGCGGDDPEQAVGADAPDVPTTVDTEADAEADSGELPPAGPRRVLIIIADDLGVDSLRIYGEEDDGRKYAPTPTIDGICAAGVRFERAWSAPTCSPTRAAILTGRYGLHNGVGWALEKYAALSLDEVTLPEALDAAGLGVAHANIGKWHLGDIDAAGGALAPNTAGWGYYAGSLGGGLPSYEKWARTVEGATAVVDNYATTQNVDDAIGWLEGRADDEPWLVWLAFNAPHVPFHLPPGELHSRDKLPGTDEHIDANAAKYYRAMVEAMDTEVGRLLAWLEANGHTDVDAIFLGDNGTPGQATQPPSTSPHAKGSLYQGGVHVPLCVAGPSVVSGGRVSDALAHVADLYPTVLERRARQRRRGGLRGAVAAPRRPGVSSLLGDTDPV